MSTQITSQVPIIDISCIYSKELIERELFEEIASACSTCGFFYIKNHPVSPLLIKDVFGEAQAFFKLSKEEKHKVARFDGNFQGYSDTELTKRKKDWKEIFDFSTEHEGSLDISGIHGRNQWPQNFPLFKEKMLKYFAEMRKLGLGLMRAIFHSLSESNVETFMEECFAGGEDTSFGRLNFYPVCPLKEEKEQLGVGPHSDAGVLTILFQEEGISSLQVCKEGVWHDVPPIKDTFVVNIGDMSQVWSNGKYPAPIHRVKANHTQTRFSLPFFLNPSYSCVVQPLGKGMPMYRPITWSEFRSGRVKGDYADVGEELQISHYFT